MSLPPGVENGPIEWLVRPVEKAEFQVKTLQSGLLHL
jgi:hypothetical protein